MQARLLHLLFVFLLPHLARAEPQALDSSTPSTEKFEISESGLLQLISGKAPDLSRIRSSLYSQQAERAEKQDAFAGEIYSTASLERSNEQPLIEFAPVFTPVGSASLGYRQQTPWGVELDAGITLDRRSAQSSVLSIDKGTTLVGSLSLTFDLWKDFLGRTSRADLTDKEKAEERALLQEKIDTHHFKIQVRHAYWQLVANQESQRVTTELLNKAKLQAADAKRRRANSVSDNDEVALYESQVTDRQARLVMLDYQKDLLIQNLKTLLPVLQDKEILLDKYSIETTIDEVLACTQKIGTFSSAPKQFTHYDEIANAIALQRDAKLRSHARYDDIDLKLVTLVKTTGVDPGASGSGSIGSAFSDLKDNDRVGYGLGLELTIPLGGSAGDTSRLRRLRDEHQADADIQSFQTRIELSHRQLLKSVAYLAQVVQLQKENVQHLRRRIKGLERKYQQARIDVSTLVNDQSAQLNADLDLISTQTEVLKVIFEYLSVFSETPCTFNRS